jgi:hypothetical protein
LKLQLATVVAVTVVHLTISKRRLREKLSAWREAASHPLPKMQTLMSLYV